MPGTSSKLSSGYFFPVALSVSLHALLVVFAIWGWEPSEAPKKKVMPRYVNATLVTIEPKTKKAKVAKKSKVIDLTAKRLEQKRLKEAARKKRLAKEKAERERLRKLAEEKARKEKAKKEKLAKAERERLEKEREKQQQIQREAAFADALAEEESLLLEQEDAATAQSYVAQIARRIEQNWSRPPSARKGMKCELQIQLVPTGEVINVSVIKGSGNGAFDRSAEQAVKKVGRFDELKQVEPEVFERYFRQLTLVFNPQDLRL